MELVNTSCRYVYTKEQLLNIRDEFVSSGGPDRYPIAGCAISLDPEKRIPKRKTKPAADTGAPYTRSLKNSDVLYSTSGDISGGGDSTQNFTGWRRTRRTSGGTLQSPMDTSQRHNSGSSGGEESGGGSGNNGGAVRREFDWTLGCGKWRHRSASGSERGIHKGAFCISGGRGRGRGGGGGTDGPDFHRQQGIANGNVGVFSGSPGTRGRGFMRRPFQHGGQSGRGGRGGSSFKPSTTFASHGPEHGPTEKDFEPQEEHYQNQHPLHQHPYPSHHYTSQHFNRGFTTEDSSQLGETRWDHHAPTATTTPDQLPLVSSPPTEQPAANSVPPPPKSPSAFCHIAQPAQMSPVVESAGAGLDEGVVTMPIKDSFPFMPAFPSHPLVESQPQGAIPTLAPQPSQPSPTMWYYRDPSGRVRGPYDDATMAAWFSAGYFPVQIEVRRECDKVFSRITDFITMLGRFPFVGSSELPPILEHRAPPAVPVPPAVPLPPPLLTGMAPRAPLPTPTPNLLPQQMNLSPAVPTMTPATLASATLPQAQAPLATVGEQMPLVDPNQWYYRVFSNLASKSIFDLNSLTKATLSEIVRLNNDAQRLRDRVCSLGMDQNLLAKSLAALSLGTVEDTVSSSIPPDVIDLQHLEAAIHRRQQEENEELKRRQQQQQPQQQAVEESTLPPPPSVGQKVVEDKQKEEERNQATTPSSHKKQTIRKEKTTKADISSKSPVELEPPPQLTAKKRKRKPKAEIVATAASVEKAEEDTEQAEPTGAVEAAIEPEDDWVAVTTKKAVSHAPRPSVICSPPSHHDQEQQEAKKPKKKKKSKSTANELRQQAWEQEEKRRRRANEERIAQAEAEAAAAAAAEEEAEKAAAEAAAAAAAAKMSAAMRRQQAETQRLLEQRKAREAAMREAAANLAHLKLPATSRWGAAPASNGGGSGCAASAPYSMAEIFASQLQEEELERAKPASVATFASKLVGGVAGAMPAPVTTKPKMLVSVEATQKAPTQPKHPPSGMKTTTVVNKSSVLSIWDLPTDPQAAKPSTSKKANKKKKANASSHLLTGPIISLAPKARAELVRWCEGQLSGFPRDNVDIPTLISLLCDIEEAEDVLECIESSFGKSQRVSKFSKAFVEKRAHLMDTTA